MKTSTTFACSAPESEKELNFLIYSFLEKNKEFRKDFGLQKIFSLELNEYIGIGGLIRCSKKIEGYTNIVIEGARFLKSKYIGKGMGLIVDSIIAQKVEALKVIMVGAVWEEHPSSNHLLIKYGMSFMGKTTKTYKDKTININMYIKFPSTIKDFKGKVDVESFLISKKIS